MGHPVCTDIETYQIEHGHAGKVPRRDPVRGAHVALEVRDLLEELQAVLAEQPLVNLLHVQEEAVQVADGLAHRAHVLLARVHLGVDSIEKIWLEFRLEKRIEIPF